MNVLVTGANRGIGFEFTKQYIQDNYHVIACCREPEKAKNLSALQQQFPKQLTIEKLDVRSTENINHLAEKLKSIPIDILISNAGIYGPSGIRFGALEKQEFVSLFETNCIAPILMAQAFISHIEKSQLKTIVNISSQMASIALNTYGDAYYYRASKTALNAVSRCLAIDLKRKEIKVLILDPGWVKTDMGGKDAEIEVDVSVRGMRKVILESTIDRSGDFISYENIEMPW